MSISAFLNMVTGPPAYGDTSFSDTPATETIFGILKPFVQGGQAAFENLLLTSM